MVFKNSIETNQEKVTIFTKSAILWQMFLESLNYSENFAFCYL